MVMKLKDSQASVKIDLREYYETLFVLCRDEGHEKWRRHLQDKSKNIVGLCCPQKIVNSVGAGKADVISRYDLIVSYCGGYTAPSPVKELILSAGIIFSERDLSKVSFDNPNISREIWDY